MTDERPRPRVTDIYPDKRDPNLVHIVFSQDQSFTIPFAELSSTGVAIGVELTPEQEILLAELSDRARCLSAGMMMLTVRPRSVHELRTRLRQKRFSDDAIDAAIVKLEGWRYLNDEDFARIWVDNRQSNRPSGERLLRQELRQKGVDREIIQETLESSEIDEAAIALVVARSKFRSYRDLPPEIAERRLAGFLARRGFGYDTIKPALDTLFGESDDHPLNFDPAES